MIQQQCCRYTQRQPDGNFPPPSIRRRRVLRVNNAINLYDALIANNYSLPQTLRDCYEAFREEELQRVCMGVSPDEQKQLINVLQAFLNDASVASFNQVFSLINGDLYDDDPPGTVIRLPETLLSLITRFEHANELQSLVDYEAERLRLICERKEVSPRLIEILGHLAAEGLSDIRQFKSTAEVIRYVAANVSPEIKHYLVRAAALMDARLSRTFRFPDMVAFRIEQISALGKKYGITFTLDDFRCFSDPEVKMISRDHRAFCLLPNCKHYAICERCQDRVMRIAQRWMKGLEPPPPEYAGLPIFRRR